MAAVAPKTAPKAAAQQKPMAKKSASGEPSIGEIRDMRRKVSDC